jgi:hypothetical protein
MVGWISCGKVVSNSGRFEQVVWCTGGKWRLIDNSSTESRVFIHQKEQVIDRFPTEKGLFLTTYPQMNTERSFRVFMEIDLSTRIVGVCG